MTRLLRLVLDHVDCDTCSDLFARHLYVRAWTSFFWQDYLDLFQSHFQACFRTETATVALTDDLC